MPLHALSSLHDAEYTSPDDRILLDGDLPRDRRSPPTAADSAFSPATPSAPRPTSASPSSPSRCCTARATSTSTSTPTGQQTETPVQWKPEERARAACEPRVTVTIEGRAVQVRARGSTRCAACRAHEVPVFLLDTTLPENTEYDRTLTDSLYGGDEHYRLCQEIVLGDGRRGDAPALGYRRRDHLPPERRALGAAHPRSCSSGSSTGGGTSSWRTRTSRRCGTAASSRRTRRCRRATTSSRSTWCARCSATQRVALLREARRRARGRC